ncbi:uncharacterized protein LOC100185168 [Ciona intestinalis]
MALKLEDSTVPYLDQCRVICLMFAEHSCSGAEATSDIQQFLQNEIQAFDFSLDHFLCASEKLRNLALCEKENDVKLKRSVDIIMSRNLDQKVYDDEAVSLVGEDEVSSWQQIAMLLQLMFDVIKSHQYTCIEEIVDMSARCLRNLSKDFILLNGWVPTDRTTHLTSEISSSIVIVPSGIEEEIHQLAKDDEYESYDSATPPEILEKPPMTASLIDMLGGGDANVQNLRLEQANDGNGFEMVASVATQDALSEPHQTVDHSIKENVEQISSDSNFGNFIPHISIGVAAAAACIGFILLKKSS